MDDMFAKATYVDDEGRLQLSLDDYDTGGVKEPYYEILPPDTTQPDPVKDYPFGSGGTYEEYEQPVKDIPLPLTPQPIENIPAETVTPGVTAEPIQDGGTTVTLPREEAGDDEQKKKTLLLIGAGVLAWYLFFKKK